MKQRNWKVGDKVKVTKDKSGHGFKIGVQVEVVCIGISDYYLCSDGKYSWHMTEEEGELIKDKVPWNISPEQR